MVNGCCLTVPRQYSCPFCEYTAESQQSVVFHITGRSDDAHADKYGGHLWDEIEAVDVDGASSSEGGTESPDGTSGGTVEFPTADGGSSSVESTDESTGDGGPSCCSDPSLAGGAGEVFRLESGEHVQLESGEEICVNCDTIHETR